MSYKTTLLRNREALDKLKELGELYQNHWKELATNRQLMSLKPDYSAYEALADADRLFAVLVYAGPEAVVGYSVNFVYQHLHYADLRVCSNDLLYVAPAYRGSSVGARLMSATKAEAADRGAKLMLWHAKEGTALDRLLTKRACRVQDIIYSEVLDDGRSSSRCGD